jgi:hypothetical protein
MNNRNVYKSANGKLFNENAQYISKLGGRVKKSGD